MRGVNFEDAEATAALALKTARMDGEEEPDPVLVAKAMGIPVLPTPPQFMVGKLGDCAIVEGRIRIHVRRGLVGAPLLFTVAHELGHACVRRFAMAVDLEEQWCNAFAGALLVPREPLRLEWARAGGDVRAIARRWSHVPPTCAALRIGEARLADVFVVQSRGVRYLRSAAIATPSVIDIGDVAARRGSVRRGGLRAARLRDGMMRAAVLAECA